MPSLLGWLEQASRDVPSTDDWLASAERAILARSPVAKRREEWRLGRWTAKRLLVLSCGAIFRSPRLPAIDGVLTAWSRLEVKAAADGAPEAFLDGRPLPVRLSITHRAGRAACLVAPEGVQAGCDMELIEPREPSFVEDYFTPGERAVVLAAPDDERALVTTVTWSAKESALKALRVGLRADTREVDVRLLPWLAQSGWLGLAVHRRDRPRLLSGWWRLAGPNVVTLVSFPPTTPPGVKS